MVLIDTGVWLSAMHQSNAATAKIVRGLIDRDLVVGHDFVHGELMLSKGGKARQDVVDLYGVLTRLETIKHEIVMSFAKKHKLDGRGLSWADLNLLASASTGGALLWTGDKALGEAANELEMNFDPTKDAS